MAERCLIFSNFTIIIITIIVIVIIIITLFVQQICAEIYMSASFIDTIAVLCSPGNSSSRESVLLLARCKDSSPRESVLLSARCEEMFKQEKWIRKEQ